MTKNDRILALRKAAEAMARGDFSTDIPSGDDEIGHLGKALKDLSAYLKKQSERSHSLYQIMVECNLNLHLVDVLNHIYESFREHLPYDRICLALLDSSNTKLKLHWVRAEYDLVALNIGHVLPVASAELQTIIDGNGIQVINDLSVYLEKHAESQLVKAILKEGIYACLVCPLVIDGKPIGFVFFSSRKKNIYNQSHIDLPLQIASQLSVIIEKTQLYRGIKLNKQLMAQKKSLQRRVTHDALTGLFNRSAIFDILHKQIQRAKRGGFGLTVIMIDIDRFKTINDTYGHLAGDTVLCEIAERLTKSARSHEYIGRYGGEEFLAIISPYDREGAAKAAERFRQAVANQTIPADDVQIPVTISIGVAISTESQTLVADTLLRRADEALYAAKHKGRNRVEIVEVTTD
ncbi:MAG: diguanylate cyclase [Nitrosomonas sp.]|nr:MAG: diguanylate cyclase [Nitrosomonas sp.]